MAIRHLAPTAMHAPAGQYSHGVHLLRGSELLFVAGQIGAGADGAMAEGLEAQVRQAFLNLEAVLGEVGMGLSDLVQINYYLLDPAGMEILRHIRADYLPEPPPASTALIVKALARPEWLFELDAIAARSSGEAR